MAVDWATAAVAAVPGALTSVLLFVQNDRSSKREAAGRTEERQAEQARGDRELAVESARLKADGETAARADQRRRAEDFLAAAYETRTALLSGDAWVSAYRGHEHTVDPQLIERLSRAAAAARLDANNALGNRIHEYLGAVAAAVEALNSGNRCTAPTETQLDDMALLMRSALED